MDKKTAFEHIKKLAEKPGTHTIDITQDVVESLVYPLSKYGRSSGTLIQIRGEPGAYVVNVIKSSSKAPPVLSAERAKLRALNPGQSVTFELGAKTLHNIEQKMRAEGLTSGARFTRRYDSKTHKVTVTRIDKTDIAPGNAGRHAAIASASYMTPGGVIYIIDTTLQAARNTCAYRNRKPGAAVTLTATESPYDGAIEIACRHTHATADEHEAIERQIKKARVARVLYADGYFDYDGSRIGSGVGYDGLTFFTSQIDDILHILPVGQTITFPGTTPKTLQAKAKEWQARRGLKGFVVSGNAVTFE